MRNILQLRIFIPAFLLGFIFTFAQTTGTEDSPTEGPFITIWKTTNPGISTNKQIRIPAHNEYDYEWEEVGNESSNGSGTGFGEETITFPSPGTYKLMVYPNDDNGTPFDQIQFAADGDVEKIIEISNWGEVEWSSFEEAFYGASNMTITAGDIPDLSNVTSMSTAFAASGITTVPNINNWDTSNVMFMDAVFAETGFNSNISNWNMSNVIFTYFMFAGAYNFNQPIGSWNMSSVIDMEGMFYEASSFNQPIENWDVSSVDNMFALFAYAENFNQPIGNWNVSNVVEMGGLFGGAASFNQNISNWDTSSAQSMYAMFAESHSFNQDISGWDVSNVTEMTDIFEEATSFDQNLDSWNLKNISGGQFSFADSGMQCENYSRTLMGWAGNPDISNNVILEANGLEYSGDSEPFRDFLINEKNWQITGDSMGGCALISVKEVSENNISIFPNPASDFLNIKGLNGASQIILSDINGRVLRNVNTGKSSISLDIKDLKKGIYILNITYKNGKTTSKKVIKK